MTPSDLAKLLSRKDALETVLGRFEVWLLIFGVLVGIGVAGESVFGIRTWWNNRKLQEVNQQIDQYRQSENAQVSQRAGEALERAAKAEENLAEANERAANAEKAAAEASRMADEEHTARLKIDALLAPRRVSSAQEETVKGILKLKNPKITLFVITGNPEIADFASDLERVFKNSGLTVAVNHGITFGGVERGISAIVSQSRIGDLQIVAEALKAAGLITESLPAQLNDKEPDVLTLTIAPK